MHACQCKRMSCSLHRCFDCLSPGSHVKNVSAARVTAVIEHGDHQSFTAAVAGGGRRVNLLPTLSDATTVDKVAPINPFIFPTLHCSTVTCIHGFSLLS